MRGQFRLARRKSLHDAGDENQLHACGHSQNGNAHMFGGDRSRRCAYGHGGRSHRRRRWQGVRAWLGDIHCVSRYHSGGVMNEAVIVAGLRTAVGKAPRGTLRTTRPDDMAAEVISALLKSTPAVSRDAIDDVIIGCAMPEGESGTNV